MYVKIARLYYWPGMSNDIRQHAKECDECQRTKPSTQALQGELEPLPIPKRPWKSIAMGFLGPLPESSDKSDMILVVIDCLTMMAHFIATKTTVISSQVADLFLENIFLLWNAQKHCL
jgi:hypothetical protein